MSGTLLAWEFIQLRATALVYDPHDLGATLAGLGLSVGLFVWRRPAGQPFTPDTMAAECHTPALIIEERRVAASATCDLPSPDAMTAPKPDRSNTAPNFGKTEENSVIDLGWNEGFLSDARPYRVESWTEDGIRSLTFFLSTNGIETYSNEQFANLLEREELITYLPGRRRSAYAMPYTDASGNSLWSVNVVIGDDDETFVNVLVELRSYARGLAQASLHTAPTADVAWATLAGSLARCLVELQEDEFLILNYKRANYYVQFAALGEYGMRAEASCNTFIEPEAALTDDQYAKMADLGWQRATELGTGSGVSDNPDGSPNFFLDIARPVNHAALGQLAVRTLRTVYGVTHPGKLRYSSFGENDTSIRFPTLGLKRQSV